MHDWYVAEVAKELRPDKCGVVFEKISQNIFLGTKEKKTKLKKVVMNQIASFIKQGYSVIINSWDGDTEIYKSEKVSKKSIINELKEKHGGSELYRRFDRS